MPSLEQFREVVTKRLHQYEGATLSVALVRHEAKMRILRGTMMFRRGPDPPRERLDYGHLVLERKPLTCDEAVKFIEAASSGTPIEGYDSFPTALRWNRAAWKIQEALPTPVGRQRISDWPAEEFVLSLDANFPSDPLAPLVKSELPLIVYPPNGISEWIGWNSQWTSVQSGLVIVLPDYRARIRRILLAEKGVDVEIETSLLTRDKVLVKATADGREVVVNSEAKDGKCHVPFTSLPASLYVFALDKEADEVVDWAEAYTGSPAQQPGVEYTVPSTQLERIIEAGETNKVEFKSERGDGFTIIQSVVAFANTEGGIILVGVGDDCLIVGTDPEADQDKLEEWIDKRCDPPVAVEYATVEIGAKKVLTIQVPKGGHRPYMHRDNGVIYVRRGANDRPARRPEVDAFYSETGPYQSR